MKIITILALHLNHGGIERYISLLCKMLEDDFKVEIISTYKHPNAPIYSFSNKINIKYLIDDYPDRVSLKQLVKNHKIIKIIKECIRRCKLLFNKYYLNINEIKNIKSDFVITTRFFHNELVSKYLNNDHCLKIATEHNSIEDEKYIKKLIRSVRNFDYFIACTTRMQDFYQDKINIPIKIIPNTVDINNNKISQLNNYNLISVGRLSPEKGYEELIDVMKYVYELNKKVKLTICGDGYLKPLLKEKIEKHNLQKNVKLKGFVNDKELENEYTNASIYVLPSRQEAFGLVLLEAMHYGLPCIAFDTTPGAQELLENNVGILVSDRNCELMAQKIVELLDDTNLRKQYSENSQKQSTNYSLKKIKKIWLDFLNNS